MINISDYEEFVCLGSCCEPKLVLKECNISIKSFPFDWLMIENYDDISNQLNNNFENFLKIVMKFHGMYQYEIPNIENTEIYLPHFDGNVDILKHKIQNFNTLMKSNKKILFILKSHINKHPTQKQINNVLDAIIRHTKSNFTLLIFNEYLTHDKIYKYVDNKNYIVYNHVENVLSNQYVVSIIPCCVLSSKKHIEVWKKILYKL